MTAPTLGLGPWAGPSAASSVARANAAEAVERLAVTCSRTGAGARCVIVGVALIRGLSHEAHLFRWIGSIEHGGTGYEGVGSCSGRLTDGVERYASVNLEPQVDSRFDRGRTEDTQLGQCLAHERLTAESGLDGHHQHHVDLGK